MSIKTLAWAVGIFLVCGCSYYPLRQHVDDMVCSPTALDPAPPPSARMPAPAEKSGLTELPDISQSTGRDVDANFGILQTAAQDQPPVRSPLLDRIFKKMTEVPGAEVPPIQIPVKGKNLEEYRKAMQKVAAEYLKRLPPLEPEFEPAPGPNGQPLTLAHLQRLARTNSPLLRQAAAAVEAAKGAAQQASYYPNPSVTVSAITFGPSGGPNAGPSFNQTIKTMNKLGLGMAAAEKDLRMAELALRRAETDLAWNVRSQYFAVLVARESIHANRALAQLTDEIYNVMSDVLRLTGEVSMYEPMQMAVFAQQARIALIQARANYNAAWKTLATTLGLPAMPPTKLSPGRITEVRGLPHYVYGDVLAYILKNHTDVQTAEENIDKARYLLRLAQVTPVPDLNASVGGFYDNNQFGPPGSGFRWVTTFGLGFTIPVWDQNKGAVRQMQGNLVQMMEEPHRVRNALTASLVGAFQRYDSNRTFLRIYEKEILPKQIQALRGAVRRYDVSTSEIGPWDIVTAEQNLVTAIAGYLPMLGATWQAIADVASLLQTDDIFQMATKIEPFTMVDLEQLLHCCHPCSPLQNPRLKTLDPNYPPTANDVLRPLAPTKLPEKKTMNTTRSSMVPQEIRPALHLEFGTAIPMDESRPQPQITNPTAPEVQIGPIAPPTARNNGNGQYPGYGKN